MPRLSSLFCVCASHPGALRYRSPERGELIYRVVDRYIRARSVFTLFYSPNEGAGTYCNGHQIDFATPLAGTKSLINEMGILRFYGRVTDILRLIDPFSPDKDESPGTELRLSPSHTKQVGCHLITSLYTCHERPLFA
jgi:hypothetical protein